MTESTANNDLITLQARLAENQDGILELLAEEHGVSLQAAVESLPEEMWKRVSGEHFVEALTDIASWGDVTIIVHTKDVIMEAHGPLPEGRVGHGFYNLRGGGAVSGHLRAENCKAIIYLRRPFMGKETASVQFFNAKGEAMFKIFVGRNEAGALKADQIDRFTQLENRLNGAGR
ncbi:heme utilization cystosolic carrier protein HutX [Chelativorans sp. AA-79]|uniref:heme utilization cystosolic carrier protein HutX n=1 Tax=Chelativorans sp. AA-79 TaxID=3028735 RepID=UPI0023F640F3|nr:heme utilization cystosolic carrier protein HutX [Chelativorans sp. AA-79]WEX08553.1 heme utilization cystosolic carrier protein HutX [Chelativorans sp. AA-79]